MVSTVLTWGCTEEHFSKWRDFPEVVFWGGFSLFGAFPWCGVGNLEELCLVLGLQGWDECFPTGTMLGWYWAMQYLQHCLGKGGAGNHQRALLVTIWVSTRELLKGFVARESTGSKGYS